MSTRHDPDRDLERLFDDDRGDFGALYQRLGRKDPPRRLDRAVLAEAARAVHDGRPPRTHRWVLGLGSAAGLVMAAGIAWQVGQQMDTRDVAPAPATTPASRSSHVISVVPIAEQAPISEESAPPPSASNAGTDFASKEAPAMRAQRTPVATPQVAAPAPVALPPPPAAMAIEPAPAVAEESMSRSDEPAAAMDDGVEAKGAAVQGDNDRERVEAAAARSDKARREKAEPNRAPAPSTSAQLRRNMRLPPQDWLAEITRLHRTGQRQQAVENLLLFRRMHPDWSLSDDLRKLIE
jgi:hypothetical protein